MTQIDSIPRHVAIIMDGNGRWAQRQGKERLEGHLRGVESVRNVMKAAAKQGVEYLTLYVFSTENWDRPKSEVDGLMELLCESTIHEVEALKESGVRIEVIGDLKNVPGRVREHLEAMKEQTAGGENLTVVLALNYGSREEISSTVREIVESVVRGESGVEQITPEMIRKRLYTKNIPDPDLLIRPGGEMRLSNFLLWQAAYAELYFTEVLWPDFGEREFAEALESYASRERRYGRITK